MARQAASIFAPPPPSKSAPATNIEGYPAFVRPPKEQLLQTLLTNTCGSTFYETKDKLVADTERVHTEALQDPAFMAQALVYARNKGFARTQPVYGLARVAAVADGSPFESAFSGVVKTPNDLIDFASIIRSLRNGEGGRRIKRVAGNWLRNNLTEYWAIKYGSEAKATYALRDLFRAYHPKGEALPVAEYLLRRGESSLAKLPQIAAFEALKKATTDADKIAAITAGRLPHEVATSFAGNSKKVWESIIPNLPIFALLRNLATLERHGVLDAAKDRIVNLFGDAEQVRRSKIFPFRFLEAIKHVNAPWAQDALRVALEYSFAGAEQLTGKTVIALDISGSMSGHIQMASVFGISTARRSDGSRFMLFNDRVGDLPVSRVDSVLTQAQRIGTNGGTDTGQPIALMIHERFKADNLVLITDEQQNQGQPFMNLVSQYRRNVNSALKVFVLNVAPYTGGALLDTRDPGNYYVYGLTESSLTFIAHATRGWDKFVDHVQHRETN